MQKQPTHVIDGFFFPPDFKSPHPLEFNETHLTDRVVLRQVLPTVELIQALGEHLKRAGREVLFNMPIDRVVDVLDSAADAWLEKKVVDFDAVMEGIGAVTGFSPQMVRESLRIEQESSRADDIRAALANEFGDPGILDNFTPRPGTRTLARAVGPELTFCFLPGNIPALSHLPFMRTLAVKSPFLCKTSTTEPIYAAAYARTLAGLCPEIGRCLGVVYWPGGKKVLEEAVFRHADAIIAFGKTETCADIAARARYGTKLLLHGHKLGFAIVGNQGLDPTNLRDLAGRLAYDVAMFDQQACLSPHWIFVEQEHGSEAGALAEALVNALRDLEKDLPKGSPPVEEAVSFSRTWDDAELAGAIGEPVTVFSKRGSDRFLVIVDGRRPLKPSCLGRMVSLIPVGSIQEIEGLLAPLSGYFQNAALEMPQRPRLELAEKLAKLGVSRICRPGRMATPTMMWHHDGAPCLEALVRYCDLETESD